MSTRCFAIEKVRVSVSLKGEAREKSPLAGAGEGTRCFSIEKGESKSGLEGRSP